MLVYQCEDSLEGIFTAIYNAYERKAEPVQTMLSCTDELFLFAEYHSVKPDWDKVMKVIRTLKRRFGEEDYLRICYALSSDDPSKAQAVYQTIVQGLAGSGVQEGHLFDNLANTYVYRAFSLARAAGNESCHLRGFVRFNELENGILYSKIGPKNNVLTFLMPHFADRFPSENFIIHDEKRNLFGVHPARERWYLVGDTELDENSFLEHLSASEMKYQELFRYFCSKVAIKERTNVELQKKMLPLRFQEYMTEFC